MTYFLKELYLLPVPLLIQKYFHTAYIFYYFVVIIIVSSSIIMVIVIIIIIATISVF